MPPSNNALYRTFTIRGVERRARSQAYTEWLSLMRPHTLRLNCDLEKIRRMAEGTELEVIIHLLFPHGDVYTTGKKAKSKVQKMDAANRDKAIHDWLSDAIGVDDSWFFRCTIQKFAARAGQDVTPCADVMVRAMTNAEDI